MSKFLEQVKQILEILSWPFRLLWRVVRADIHVHNIPDLESPTELPPYMGGSDWFGFRFFGYWVELHFKK